MILDMGEPVKIVDLARDLILLSGLRYPDDIDIVFSGVRAGEKMEEELFYPTETGSTPIHDKIFCGAPNEGLSMLKVLADLAQLEASFGGSAIHAKEQLRTVVERHADRTWLEVPQARAA
jgi:FlaA1/EpsC-like NDP-sugar epimerase